MNTDRINYINIGLIILSCIAAFFLPFELFLFSYGILGPLHYLTEIGWLHKKNYFTKGKYDFVFLVIICSILFYYSFFAQRSKQAHDPIFFSNLIALGLMSSAIFVFIKDWLYRIALIVLSFFVLSFFGKSEHYYVWISIFLPTIIHVFIFTWLFMLYGVLKEKSKSGFLSIIVLLICAASFFLIRPDNLNYAVSDYVQKSYSQFDLLNYYLINYFHLDELTEVKQIFTSSAGFVIMRFIAFAYTYHYLNWFSKTSVIKWHTVKRPVLIGTILLWLASIALYIYDYNVGLTALFFLSFLHVFLEFPLNVVSFNGIGKEISGVVQRKG
ncbi:MAG: hypothetical protein QM534_12645 [Sediminibacterium sp.]|nr:hypothetical protein [Sediminibacterium sp.]